MRPEERPIRRNALLFAWGFWLLVVVLNLVFTNRCLTPSLDALG
jgi:hypothetical protein